jgi:hypothetical protein
VDPPSNGTTPDKKSTSPCRGTSTKPSPVSNTLPRQSNRTSPIPTSNQIMEQKSNTHKRRTNHQPSARRGKNLSKRYVACSCSLQGRSMGGLLPALSSLASQQANPTERTMELCKKILDFMSCQEEAVLTYRASDMVLAIHRNASYLSEPKSRSRAGGHMFMAGKDEIPINNGAVLNISQIIRAVMSSAAEAELGALFINAKTAVSMRQTLIELGHLQPHTQMQTDNATAV